MTLHHLTGMPVVVSPLLGDGEVLVGFDGSLNLDVSTLMVGTRPMTDVEFDTSNHHNTHHQENRMIITNFTTDNRYDTVYIKDTKNDRTATFIGWATVKDGNSSTIEPVALIDGQPFTQTEYAMNFDAGTSWAVHS